ncbi:MAG TPA: hypothetical protein VHF06_03350 [Pseudonocardiaceae bacterium]|nr:hypothetical protein [Pseudonocardiaceae bacterium]
MTDLAEFIAHASDDVAGTRRVTDRTWERYARLAPRDRAALHRVAAFLGGPGADDAAPGESDAAPVDPGTRLRLAELMLSRFAVNTGEPVWSSKAMENLVDAQLAIPGGEVCDVFAAAMDLWARHRTPLTTTVANFVRAITVLCFTQYRSAYRRCDLTPLIERVRTQPTAPGAYLAANALPPHHWPAARPAILAALTGTPYADQVATMLQGD